MAQTTVGSSGNPEVRRLTLSVWHPDCWTLEVTDETDAEMIAHTLYNGPEGTIKGHFTVFADRVSDIDDLVANARASPLTDSVVELNPRHVFDEGRSNVGNTTRQLMVDYDPDHTMIETLLKHGFVHDAPVRIADGREHWPVTDTVGGSDLSARIDALREESNADVTVEKVTTTADTTHTESQGLGRLSSRQREVFELARRRNYYAWPRGTTTRELAEELDIAKTTLLEHLRKAEAKLLNEH